MKLKSLRLRNISCFEDITLDFCHEKTGEPCKWVVLLGENGTGKSTICQMIIKSSHPPFVDIVAPGMDISSYIRDVEIQKSMQVTSASGVFFNGHIKSQKDITDDGHFHYRSSNASSFSLGNFMTSSEDFQFYRLENDENLSKKAVLISGYEGWYIGGYGPQRTSQLAIKDTSFPLLPDLGIPFRFGSLFSGGHITNAQKWISDLYLAKIHPQSTERDRLLFDTAITALNTVLPNAKFEEVTKDGEVMMNDSGNLVSINRLSDGNKSTLTWVLDLTRRLCDAFPADKFPDLESPLHAHGVVLVDEIDLHLHPRWQRKVVEMIRKTFPNIQFIVTTHSPFVAQDMTEDDKLIVLKRGENGAVYAEHGMGFAKRWRADQILTSWLFDLETTRDGDADTDEKDYQALLEKEVSEKLTDEEKARLRELKQRLDKDPLGATLSDQEIYAAADALTAALRANDPD
jgi:ABC-type multidrug transport system ATPase subunit